MRKAKQQDNGEKPLSTYIMVAAVAVLTLWLVYFVNVELLPLIFDIDREVYRQALINLGSCYCEGGNQTDGLGPVATRVE